MRKHPNIETVAFIAIGAEDVLRERKYQYNADGFGGRIGFIGEVCAKALMLDRMADAALKGDREFTVLFAYEVGEQFGREYALALLENTSEKPEDIAERLIAAGIAV